MAGSSKPPASDAARVALCDQVQRIAEPHTFHQCRIDLENAISSAIGLLGFGRATQKIAASVEERLRALVQSGALEQTEGVITLSASASCV